jgi:cytidylate kinase
MVIIISGSVNAGKSTTSKLVADKLKAEWIDIDELAHQIPSFNLDTDISKAIGLALVEINKLTAEDKNVVANYVLRQEDYEQMDAGIKAQERYYFTLVPKLDVARSDRGRGMNDWEYERVKFHYDTGIASPKFGSIIDTSKMTLDEVANDIIRRISSGTK